MSATRPEATSSLEREVLVHARRATVFGFFTESAKWARWWGEGSTIEPRRGGAVRIRYPNGIQASGEVLEIVPGERIAFTFGYDSGNPIPAGSTRVTIALSDAPQGTLVRLHHELPDAAIRDAHVAGWRYQLAVFANVAAEVQNDGLSAVADRWCAAWNEGDDAARRRALESCTAADVSFRDAFGCTRGRDELLAHIAAVQRFMPGLKLAREGDPRQCQGVALVEWATCAADGKVFGRGTNVFVLSPDGLIADAVGFRASAG